MTDDIEQKPFPLGEIPENATPKTETVPGQIAIEDFIAKFDEIEAGKPFQITEIPGKEQAIELARKKRETQIIQLPTGEINIYKGLGGTQTALTRGELVALQPERKIHTHPTQKPKAEKLAALLATAGLTMNDIDVEAFGLTALVMPSPEDLTLGGVGAVQDEIWSEYGTTRYTPYRADSDASVSIALRMMSNAYRSRDFLLNLGNGSIPLKERINNINRITSALGIHVEFEPWE